MGSGCRQRRVGVAADYLSMITISEHKNLGPKNSGNAIPLAPALHVCNYRYAGSDLFICSCRSQRCRQRPALRPTTAHPVSACVACSDRRRAVVERQDVCLADTEVGVCGDKGCAPVVDKQLHLPQSHTPFITTKPRHVKSVQSVLRRPTGLSNNSISLDQNCQRRQPVITAASTCGCHRYHYPTHTYKPR